MKKIYILVIFIVSIMFLIAGVSYLGSPGSKTEGAYQKKMDMQRIADVHSIVALVEEYKGKTGYYPLANIYDEEPFKSDSDVQSHRNEIAVIVIIHNNYEYTRALHEQISKEYVYIEAAPINFLNVLKAELGDEINIPTDPQSVSNTTRPNVYKYQYVDGTYFVQADLYASTEFTTKVDDYYYAYQVGNVKDSKNVHSMEDVIN